MELAQLEVFYLQVSYNPDSDLILLFVSITYVVEEYIGLNLGPLI